MSIPYDLFDTRTDKLVSILMDASDLGEGLPATPSVYKGPRLLNTEDRAVFVHRARVDSYGYWMGLAGTDIAATWAVVCVTRHAGEPEQLEAYTSILATNVARALIAQKHVAGHWDVLTVNGSDAVSMRDEGLQTWEVEIITVSASWQHSDV